MLDTLEDMRKLKTEKERIMFLYTLVQDHKIGLATFAFLLQYIEEKNA